MTQDDRIVANPGTISETYVDVLTLAHPVSYGPVGTY
jgi:hypothetical protein